MRPLKRRAYLVSVTRKRGPVQVCAVLVNTAGEAVEAVARSAAPSAEFEIVGGLSRDLAKQLRLKLGEPRLL